MRLSLVLFFALVSFAQEGGGERWKLQYFYDVDKSTFEIADLKFPTPKRGIAVGALVSESSVKPMSAVTSDGGAHWTLAPLKEVGQSLFFLNDSLGWMITNKGLWQTEESGQTWKKVKAPRGIISVHFADPNHGWAVGLRKEVFETKNGGVDWVKLTFTDDINANPDYTHFSWIEFANKDIGMIGGASKPPRRSSQIFPDWLDPEKASNRRAWPQALILVDTRDGGKTWKPTTASLFGEITTCKFSPEGWGVGLIEFEDTFEWPSDVFFLNWRAGGQKRIYREKDRKITDVAIGAPAGPIYLAGVEHLGSLQNIPIPRKVKILRSDNGSEWNEIPVDYRAVARRVILADAGPDNLWAATDTGMILKLSK